MTTQSNNISGILNDSIIVNLEIHQWSGRKTIRATDLPQELLNQLPPSEIASLGQKNLMPRDFLGRFDTIRFAASKFLAHVGTKFLGGYIVNSNLQSTVENQLNAYKSDFEQLKIQLAAIFDQTVNDWTAQYPQWTSFLQSSIPSRQEVFDKHSFDYQIFTVSDTGNNSLSQAVSQLPSKAATDIAERIKEIVDTVFNIDRTMNFSRKTLNPLKTLIDKIYNLSFLNQSFSPIGNLLEYCYNTLIKQVKDNTTQMAVRSILLSLSSPQNIDSIGQDLISHNTYIDTIWNNAEDTVIASYNSTETSNNNDTTTDNADTDGIDTIEADTDTDEMPVNNAPENNDNALAVSTISQTALIDNLFDSLY